MLFAGIAWGQEISFSDDFSSFDYLNDPGTGQASVIFYVDRVRMTSWDTGVPQTSMHLMLNSWFPSWLDGKRPKKTTYTYVDWIDYSVQP